MAKYSYTVIFEPDAEEGGYVVHVPVLGIATQGETLEEARVMVQEAIAGYVEALQQEGQEVPVEPEQWADRLRTEQVAVSV